MNDAGKTNVQIAPLQKNDLQELADLAARTFADTYGLYISEEALRGAIANSRSVDYFERALLTDIILVAKEGRQALGYVQYGKVKIPEVSAGVRDRELDKLFVDSHIQGRGIGHMLIDAALADPLLASAPKIYIQVWPKNARAIALYRSYGFIMDGVARFTMADGVPAEDLVMVRGRR
jgi:ribosomal protein S18 acetylase RimI-like enzyme